MPFSKASQNNLLNKTKSNFSQFFFSHWLLYDCFFSFLIKAFVNFEKLVSFHRLAFTIYKKWRKFENTERNVSPKVLVYNVILVFLDHLKPKISSSANHGAPPLLFKISGSTPVNLSLTLEPKVFLLALK